MHGTVFLDEQNAVIRPAMLWCDQRTDAECAWVTARVGAVRLAELTCNLALTGFSAPKIVWLREHEPTANARLRKVLITQGLSALSAYRRVRDRRHVVRAVLEGVAFSRRDSLEIIRQLGIVVDDVRLSGGGARVAAVNPPQGS